MREGHQPQVPDLLDRNSALHGGKFGIAGAFNATIAGTLFTVEILLGDFTLSRELKNLIFNAESGNMSLFIKTTRYHHDRQIGHAIPFIDVLWNIENKCIVKRDFHVPAPEGYGYWNYLWNPYCS